MASSATIQLDADLTIAQVKVWLKRLSDKTLTDDEVMVDTAGLQLLLAFPLCVNLNPYTSCLG